MKTNTFRLLAATVLFGTLISGRAYSQGRPMLGGANPQPLQTTRLGITYQSNDFDNVWNKRIKRTAAWMNENGHAGLVPEFVDVAANVDAMREQIDEIWKERVEAWVECGGTYARAAGVDPSRILITIEAAPFFHPYYGPNYPIAGMVDGDHIRVVVANINSKGGFLQHYRNLLAYEFGNYLQLQIIGRPQNLEQEIGASSPCRKSPGTLAAGAPVTATGKACTAVTIQAPFGVYEGFPVPVTVVLTNCSSVRQIFKIRVLITSDVDGEVVHNEIRYVVLAPHKSNISTIDVLFPPARYTVGVFDTRTDLPAPLAEARLWIIPDTRVVR